MDNNRLTWLLAAYVQGKTGEEEREELMTAIAGSEPEYIREIAGIISPELVSMREMNAVNAADILQSVLLTGSLLKDDVSRGPVMRKIPLLKTAWFRYAAAFILIAGSVTFLYHIGRSPEQITQISKPTQKPDALPGVKRATLTLDNGESIVLDTASAGLLAQQGNTKIVNNNGALIYNAAVHDNEVHYNTLTTHRGEQYALTLSDGTNVLVDASSTLRFPVTFNGDARTVEINGRAWFDIAKNTTMPFNVVKGNKRIMVLGTQFDVNAYEDEAEIKVTLVQGSVKVFNGISQILLKPGQQAALMQTDERIKLTEHADVEQALAWKNGLFHFKNGDIQQVMREISRWYDIDVVYDGGKPRDTFTGDIPRNVTLNELLTIFELSRVKFKLEGKILTVINK